MDSWDGWLMVSASRATSCSVRASSKMRSISLCTSAVAGYGGGGGYAQGHSTGRPSRTICSSKQDAGFTPSANAHRRAFVSAWSERVSSPVISSASPRRSPPTQMSQAGRGTTRCFASHLGAARNIIGASRPPVCSRCPALAGMWNPSFLLSLKWGGGGNCVTRLPPQVSESCGLANTVVEFLFSPSFSPVQLCLKMHG